MRCHGPMCQGPAPLQSLLKNTCCERDSLSPHMHKTSLSPARTVEGGKRAGEQQARLSGSIFLLLFHRRGSNNSPGEIKLSKLSPTPSCLLHTHLKAGFRLLASESALNTMKIISLPTLALGCTLCLSTAQSMGGKYEVLQVACLR